MAGTVYTEQREAEYYNIVLPGLRELHIEANRAVMDMRQEGEQMNPCNACHSHQEQQQCGSYEVASGGGRCMHLRFNEYCLR